MTKQEVLRHALANMNNAETVQFERPHMLMSNLGLGAMMKAAENRRPTSYVEEAALKNVTAELMKEYSLRN